MTQKHIPAIICMMLLLIALLPFPYGYYIFLRSCICVWCLWMLPQHPHMIARTVLCGIALLYNPIIRVSLTRSIWSSLNILTVFLILAITVTQGENRRK